MTGTVELYHERAGLQEELKRRKERAGRFGTDDWMEEYRPPVDPEVEAKKKERAERFGTSYQAPDESGLIDVGTLLCRRFYEVYTLVRCSSSVVACWETLPARAP